MLKRLFDIIVSSLGIIILSPFLLLTAVTIKLDSKGPVFFKQIRVGKDEKQFKIYKFRTMVTDAEKQGLQITVGDDPRITKIGRFLRKYKLDEFPQLFNVFIGNMSFVGPRPEVPKYIALYDSKQKSILKVRPGITEEASIEYKDESEILAKSSCPEKTYIEEIMPKKIELNLNYMKNISLLYDISLMFKTIFSINK
ncbi:MAG: sugar transferase [Eubacteriaceae bacterium]